MISVRHAEKALAAGVDGLILVCAGAGGHAGMLSPFAWSGNSQVLHGPIALSGAITNGSGILAAQAMGAGFRLTSAGASSPRARPMPRKPAVPGRLGLSIVHAVFHRRMATI